MITTMGAECAVCGTQLEARSLVTRAAGQNSQRIHMRVEPCRTCGIRNHNKGVRSVMAEIKKVAMEQEGKDAS